MKKWMKRDIKIVDRVVGKVQVMTVLAKIDYQIYSYDLVKQFILHIMIY
jgi:hypothetical protein